ncbi:homogentisate 1,2-dioxygenase [Helicocarpus griseus UAMH5409]|uniref:homogentisate 1,2-dioxygenase n=1 Tax=Helicocarpus griseus UAMH5409 TaxID=1447875 RepID=A0A2B7YCK2_9EURO|nr:homogentisate 1,2-dioxygenase [Helicocarpus griseus UAMH5409]
MPASKFDIEDPFQYKAGLNSYHESEAIKGALPKPQSLPQRHSQGLYPERISGTSFTAKRAVNKQTFLYRILPSTAQSEWNKVPDHPLNQRPHSELNFVPDQLIWPPQKIKTDKTFLDGMQLIGGAGDPTTKNGVAYYFFTCGADMGAKKAFYSADGDMLIVPQMGVLDIQTEMGDLRVRPREICVVPRGIRFRVSLPKGPARGHVIEAYSGHFDVPELGPIGSLGLANVRDFEIPTAKYDDTEEITKVITKMGGNIYQTQMKGSAFNAVSWHGTYYPFKYDLGKFMPMGSTLYDHQDPSIYVVLTCPSDKPDHAAVDFLVLGPRWMVMEDTFQLPYFHRNTMSEFSSVISGGFDLSRVPESMYGMSGLNNTLSPHGLSAWEVENAMQKKLGPERVPDDTMAILVESCYPIGLSDWAYKRGIKTYGDNFGDFERKFKSKI